MVKYNFVKLPVINALDERFYLFYPIEEFINRKSKITKNLPYGPFSLKD
jgi:hypothetical protein